LQVTIKALIKCTFLVNGFVHTHITYTVTSINSVHIQTSDG